MTTPIIDPVKFHTVVNKLRQFFISKGFIEVHTQNRLSILAACEDPNTISTFDYAGQIYPLPQTGQMWLEYELLKNPNLNYFCLSTSYRNEPHPIEGRHDLIFPMFEFEMTGGIDDLIQLELELLQFLGYQKPVVLDYVEVAEKYQTKILEHTHEQRMYQDYGCAILLTNFPEYTSPFWNMERAGDKAKKIDVILSGMETIGSAERSCDVLGMRNKFYTISNGEYAQKLFNLFGQQRVTNELEEFLSHNFINRCGGGLGITRMIRSMEMEKLICY